MNTLRTPPWLLGATLLFWGWETGLPLVGALLAVLLEASRVVGIRWELSEKEFRRLWDFTTLLLATATVYLFASEDGPRTLARLLHNPSVGMQSRMLERSSQTLLLLFRWLPMVFFLCVAAQAYSYTERLPWTVVSLLARRRAARSLAPAPGSPVINTAYPYFAVCLFASAGSVRKDYSFFAGLVLLTAWGLWPCRSRRASPALWTSLWLLALAVGFGAQLGFRLFFSWADMSSSNWIAQWLGGPLDPLESRTAIGRLGRIKLSGQIVLRLEVKSGEPPPTLLRQASYRTKKAEEWVGGVKANDFQGISSETNQTTWELSSRPAATHSVTIAQYLEGRGQVARRDVLAVPQGLVRLENLEAFTLTTNPLGVVRVDEGPGLVCYDAHYSPASTLDIRPETEDLIVPVTESNVLARVAEELKLAGRSPNEILRTVADFFQDKFSYSTWLPSGHRQHPELTPLGNFLLHDRAGHCEYFATAATLLLRQAKVPTRYAVGYSVQEKSGRGFVVRGRHAHAWCLAWVNGAWHDFDVTPASWNEAEAAQSRWFEILADGWSRVWFEFSKWRWSQGSWSRYLFYALIPLLLILLGRLFVGRRWRRQRTKKLSDTAKLARPGSDSEFYQVEARLLELGLERPANEPAGAWRARLAGHPLLRPVEEIVNDLLCLHYRYRFDPAGLNAQERTRLREQSEAILRTWRNATS